MALWCKDLKNFTDFTFTCMSDFFDCMDWTNRQKCKGYKFFAEQYIHDVYTCGLSVKGKCYKSQKKNDKPHTLSINFTREVTLMVEDAHCSCEAGASQSCNHLVGLGYYLQDAILRGLEELPHETTCTSQPMAWNIPRGATIAPERVLGKIFQDPTKINRKKDPIVAKLRNPIRNVQLKSLVPGEHSKLKNSLKQFDGAIAMGYLIVPENESGVEIEVLKDITVAENSVLGYHSLCQIQKRIPHHTTSMANPDLPISLPCLLNETNHLFLMAPPVQHSNLEEFSLEECSNIEKTTRSQSDCTLWKTVRKYRFTASKFHYVCKRRVFNSAFCKEFIEDKDISHLPAIKHGTINEGCAVEQYLSKHKQLKFYKCGVVLHPYALHLGASPDGIIYDPIFGWGVLEVKCPFSKKFAKLGEACKVKDFCLTTTPQGFKLKTTHSYFYQVQGQMLVTGLTWAHFVVFFKCSQELHVEKINLDMKFCEEMFQILTSVYKEKFLPLLNEL